MTMYASVTILIALLMIGMIVHVLTYSGFNKTQKTWFVVTFISITACAGAEFAGRAGVVPGRACAGLLKMAPACSRCRVLSSRAQAAPGNGAGARREPA